MRPARITGAKPQGLLDTCQSAWRGKISWHGYCASSVRRISQHKTNSWYSHRTHVRPMLYVLYRSANRFATNAPHRTHHCTLYSSVNWSSLYTRRKTHWLMLIYETLLGLTPPYLRYLLQPSSFTYNTHSASHILLKVPKANTSLGRSSFQFAAESDCNELQKSLKLDSFISNSSFRDTLTDSCGCFAWCFVASPSLPFVLLSVPSNVCTMFCAATMMCYVFLPAMLS